MQSSTSKNLKISEMSILNLKKPQTLRMRLRILRYWGFNWQPYFSVSALVQTHWVQLNAEMNSIYFTISGQKLNKITSLILSFSQLTVSWSLEIFFSNNEEVSKFLRFLLENCINWFCKISQNVLNHFIVGQYP